jgi:hypothetical protein
MATTFSFELTLENLILGLCEKMAAKRHDPPNRVARCQKINGVANMPRIGGVMLSDHRHRARRRCRLLRA